MFGRDSMELIKAMKTFKVQANSKMHACIRAHIAAPNTRHVTKDNDTQPSKKKQQYPA